MIGTFCTTCRAMVRVTDSEQCDKMFASTGTGPCIIDGCDGKVVPLYDDRAFQSLLPGGKYVGEVSGGTYLRFLLGLGPYEELDITAERIDTLFAKGIVAIDGELQSVGYVIRALLFSDGSRAVLGPEFANGAAVIYRIMKGEVDGSDAQDDGAPGDQPNQD